jgi:7-cyano-7-deazaguanine reductase
MNNPNQSPLGKPASYADQYDPALLFPIPRADKRAELGISGAPLFMGADLWTAFEVSWLNPRGKPQLALLHLTVPCETPHIIESKSLKLYLNSLNNTRFHDSSEVQARLRSDLGAAAGAGSTAPANIGVQLIAPQVWERQAIQELQGLDLDRLDIDCSHYEPAPELLHITGDMAPVDEVLTSRLLKSNCLVTGQPDWASVQIEYSGPAIDQASLLQYIVSFRNHNEFHEQCVERIFMDIWQRCRPANLTVYARYTRRGGIDINPYRTSRPQQLPANLRTARQ